MSARRPIAFESLESRHMLSGGSSLAHFLSSDLAAAAAAVVADTPASGPIAASGQVASTIASTTWDWLAQTQWYVPTENLLAYSAPPDLTDPTPVADQTLWNITQSANGQIAGEAIVKLSTIPIPTHISFTGVVTAGGQIRIEFSKDSGAPPTTGIGQMRFVDGAWYMQMQMATGNTSLVTHWAYMAELPANGTPPDPGDSVPPGSLRAENWRWLEGTHWAIADTQLFGDVTQTGVFSINSFHNGYFWGSGTATKPFNVLGSVTPEGNLLLMVSAGGAQPEIRTGILSDGIMRLRTYEGNPAIGSAWLLSDSTIPSSRVLLSSVQSAAVQ